MVNSDWMMQQSQKKQVKVRAQQTSLRPQTTHTSHPNQLSPKKPINWNSRKIRSRTIMCFFICHHRAWDANAKQSLISTQIFGLCEISKTKKFLISCIRSERRVPVTKPKLVRLNRWLRHRALSGWSVVVYTHGAFYCCPLVLETFRELALRGGVEQHAKPSPWKLSATGDETVSLILRTSREQLFGFAVLSKPH